MQDLLPVGMASSSGAPPWRPTARWWMPFNGFDRPLAPAPNRRSPAAQAVRERPDQNQPGFGNPGMRGKRGMEA